MNHLRSAWRNLTYNKNYTAINIAGLGIALAACILIGLFVQNEQAFDSRIPAASQLYRLNEYLHYDGTAPQLSAATGAPLARFCRDDHREITGYTRVFPATPFIYSSITLAYDGKKIRTNNMACTDTSFASLFGVEIVEGNSNDFVRDHNSIVLTRTLAAKLFGTQPALNRTLQLITDDTTARQVIVSNVIDDFPANTHLQAEGFLPISGDFEKSFLGQSWGSLFGPTYFKIKPGANIAQLQSALTTTIHTKNKGIDLRLQPVRDIHSGSMEINYDYFNYNKTDERYIRTFAIIALAIFLIACCNFINLSVAIAAYRGKEIAVKKIMGAGRGHIIVQVLSETFLAVTCAILLSILLAATFLPSMNAVIGRQLPLTSIFSLRAMGAYAAVIITTTLLAGLYPALMISTAKASQALKTKVLIGASGTSLRNVLVTGQFTIALLFITGLIIFLQQLRYLRNKDLGYSYDQVMKVTLGAQDAARLDVLKSRLLSVTGVKDVSHGYMELGGKGSLFGIEYLAPDGQKKNISVNFDNVAPNYAGFFDMKIVAGRTFTKDNPNNEYLINETLARNIGYNDPVGHRINLASFPPGRIVGVVKDFNYSSLHSKIEPLLISSIDYVPVWQSQLYIKIAGGNIPATVKDITATLRAVAGDDAPGARFLDEHFRQTYESESRAGKIIAIIGGLATIIACLGLFGLAAFIMIRRTKEIGIRKVLGASAGGVVMTLSKDFIRLVGIAFAIAVPVSWWLADRWLQGFAYRISVQWWMFALAGALTVLIAFLTVGSLAMKAALANPVKSLRTE